MKIVIIGSGNVATHIALTLYKKKADIIQIYSPHLANAELLASKINASCTDAVREINKDADIYLFAIKDDAIETIAKALQPDKNAILAHTAGSVPMDVFREYAQNFGVVYPLQTFSKSSGIDFGEVPVFIEANNNKTEEKITLLAQMLSGKIHYKSSKQRMQLHLAAVFACNFTNYMYTIASDIAENANEPFDILKPLITETAKKTATTSPYNAQTGPALRMDTTTIEKHLRLLSTTNNIQQLYKLLSEGIYQRHK